jgi:hypothetical protein
VLGLLTVAGDGRKLCGRFGIFRLGNGPDGSMRLNLHEPYAYLRDVLERLPTQPASCIGELLPHRWQPVQATT